MEKENFYITLPSSASLKEFPENTKANFKTRLYKTLKFNVPYEVALTEIIFPTINNHNYNLGKVTIRRQNIAELVEKYEKKLNLKREYSVNVETNNIDPESVATSILIIVNNLIDEMKIETENSNESKHWFMSKNKVFHFELPKGFSLEFSGRIAGILGFDENKQLQKAKGKHAAISVDDFLPTIFYVYTDIIKHQFVGNTCKQLLKAVPVRLNRDFEFISFSRPNYVAVDQLNIDFIHITIKDELNNLIRFKDGFNKVIVKLHFRPRIY